MLQGIRIQLKYQKELLPIVFTQEMVTVFPQEMALFRDVVAKDVG